MTAAHTHLTAGNTVPVRVATVGASVAKALLDFSVSCCLSPDRLLEMAGLTLNEIEDPDQRIPLVRYVAMLRAAAVLSGDPAFALKFGESIDIAKLSVVGALCQFAATPAEALALMNRYSRLVIDVSGAQQQEMLRIVEEADTTWLVSTRPAEFQSREQVESAFARIIGASRRLGDTDYPLVIAAQFSHQAPAYRAEYDRILGIPLAFGCTRNALQIDRNWFTRPMPQPNPIALRVLKEHADAMLAQLGASSTTRRDVEQRLIARLHHGDASIALIAADLNLSRQTLYRRLKAEGTRFDQVLDEFRQKMAMHYLDVKQLSIGETACLLGFSELSAFSRAFKRWTGASPRNRKH